MPSAEQGVEGGALTERDMQAMVDRRLDELGLLTPTITPQPTFAVSERPPAAVAKGLVIYVPDAASGARFQGSDGAKWVALG